MSLDLLAWSEGALRPIAATDWAAVVASFLGAGFRIDLPVAKRHEAARHERARVDTLADLLGTVLDSAVWEVVTQAHPEHPIEVQGGWPRSFEGEAEVHVAVRPIRESLEKRTACVLPHPASRGPTRGLPTISRLADEVALRGVTAAVGIWSDPDGIVVTSTAGPVVAQHADGSWALGSDSHTWLACTIAENRGAQRDLLVEDLAKARRLGVVRRALGVQEISLVESQ